MKGRFLLLLALVVALGVMPADAQKPPAFVWETIDVPGATATQANDINAQGDISGSYTLAGIQHGFVLTKGEFVTVDAPEPTAYSTSGMGVSATGKLVGSYRYPGICPGCPSFMTYLVGGFVWTTGDFETVHVPGAAYTTANDANASGNVVGEYWADDQAFGYLLRRGVYTRIDMSDPADAWPWSAAYGINDNGDIVGWYGDGQSFHFHGYLLRNGELTSFDLPGYTNVQAWRINNRGEVIVRGAGASPVSYVWREGELTQVEFPGATWTRAAGINDQGDIVGQYRAPDGTLHGFVAHRRTAPRG